MDSLWLILVQFIFRVTFGMALAMACTPAKLVTSGYYRVHLWVLMGMNTFAALALFSGRATFDARLIANSGLVLALAVALAFASYVGGILWLYEKSRAGARMLFLISLIAFIGAVLATPWKENTSPIGLLLAFADLGSSGMLLGTTLAAMFLGHWYLNTPTMQLVPLQRLVLWMAAAVLIRTLLCAAGLVGQLWFGEALTQLEWVFVAMRWFSGLLGTLMMALLTWYTLKIPNTQSATGILYAGVILVFIGELASQLLSVDTLYPL